MSAFGEPSRHASIEVATRTANIVIRAADVPAPTVVRGRAEIGAGGVVVLRSEAEAEVEIHCPPGTDVSVASKTGRVTCAGVLGRVFAAIHTGNVHIEDAQSVDVRTTSARVEVDRCAGSCAIVAHSGNVEIGVTGRAEVSTASGRTTIGSAGDAMIRSASGSVHVGVRPMGVIDIKTFSGSVEVRLTEGCNPPTSLHSMSGRVRQPQRSADAASGGVTVRTMSGSITVE